MAFREEIIGPHRLILGDCREVLFSLGRFDACVTDPPYGMNWDTDSRRFSCGKSENMRRHKRGEGRDHLPVFGDQVPFDPVPWLQWPCVLWGANHFANKLPAGRTLIWVKKPAHLWGTFLSDAEIAWASGGHGVYCKYVSFPPPVRAIDAGKDPCYPTTVHPTQKPIALMEWCIGLLPSGVKTVLDPFMGSGTTGVACAKMGRIFIGIECEEKYFDIAYRRIEEAMKQPDLFIEQPKAIKPKQADLFTV